MDQLIKEFNNKKQEILIIQVEHIEEIVNRIQNYDMLFKLANDNLMLVLTKIPNNINSFDENNKKYVVVNLKENYLVCCMNADFSGLKILTPYEYNPSDDKYFMDVCYELKIENNKQNKNKIIEHIKKTITKETFIKDIIKDYPALYSSYCLNKKQKRLKKGEITEEELKMKRNICYTVVKCFGNYLRDSLPSETNIYSKFDELCCEDLTEEIIKEFEIAIIQYISNPKKYTSCIIFGANDQFTSASLKEVEELMESEHWKIIVHALGWNFEICVSNFNSVSSRGHEIDILQAPDNFKLCD